MERQIRDHLHTLLVDKLYSIARLYANLYDGCLDSRFVITLLACVIEDCLDIECLQEYYFLLYCYPSAQPAFGFLTYNVPRLLRSKPNLTAIRFLWRLNQHSLVRE